MPAMASSAPVCISTNAKPRLRPVSRSLTICAPRTVPNWENAWTRSSLVVSKEMFPTYNFLLTVVLWASVPLLTHCAAFPARKTGALLADPSFNRNDQSAVPLRRYRLDCLGRREGNSESDDQEGSKRDSGKANRSS